MVVQQWMMMELSVVQTSALTHDLLLLFGASRAAQVTSSPGGHWANERGSCFLIRCVAITKATLIWQVAFPNGGQGLRGPGGWPGSGSGGHPGGWCRSRSARLRQRRLCLPSCTSLSLWLDGLNFQRFCKHLTSLKRKGMNSRVYAVIFASVYILETLVVQESISPSYLDLWFLLITALMSARKIAVAFSDTAHRPVLLE